jgi:hypothetical protein
MKRRTSRGITFGIFQYLKTACLEKSGRLEPLIRNGDRLTTCLHTYVETMLRLGGFPERNLEFARFIADCPFNPKHISQVAVAPLIEGPHQSDAGLDGCNASRPFKFVHFIYRPCPMMNFFS